MLDQLIIGTKASQDDFDASLRKRYIGKPKKKSIKETVPFSNLTYDFSAINGEVYWEEAELEYTFEILASTPEELESKKREFSNWVMNVTNEPIYDPYEPDWHYDGTFSEMDYDDDESMLKTTATVYFTAYPYKIANEATTYDFVIPSASSLGVTIDNESSHRLTPKLNASASVTLKIGNVSYSIPSGETTDDSLKLDAGETLVTLTNQGNKDCTLNIEFYREVF